MAVSRQPMPLPSSPIADDAGVLTNQWQQFLMTLLARTGGAQGSTLDLAAVATSVLVATQAAADAAASAAFADVPDVPSMLDLTPYALADADLQTLAAMVDQEPVPAAAFDQAALLAMALADVPDGFPATIRNWFMALPTTLPGSAGVAWNNGGTIAFS